VQASGFTYNAVFQTPRQHNEQQTANPKNIAGTSPHLAGLAFDVNMSRIEGANAVSLRASRTTAGFSPVRNDPPHLQATDLVTRQPDGQVDEAYTSMLALNQAQAQAFAMLQYFAPTVLTRS